MNRKKLHFGGQRGMTPVPDGIIINAPLGSPLDCELLRYGCRATREELFQHLEIKH